MKNSAIRGFYKLPRADRLRTLHRHGFLNDDDLRTIYSNSQCLSPDMAERLIENAIGVFALPLGVGVGFLINDHDYVVPMVVEEPSIVAAISAAAKTLRANGGIESHAAEPLVYGQIQLVDLPDLGTAQALIAHHQEEIIALANQAQPRMCARGGGTRRVDVVTHHASFGHADMLVVRLLIDTRDAMGANLVNSICEAVAPRIAELTGGRVLLRILSNLTDASVVRVRCTISPESLATESRSGEAVRDDIVVANRMAQVDMHRAVTHNKGIMNGIDAVAIATGNDWRAIEAAAHAYAGRGPGYTALTRWQVDPRGLLEGCLEIPMQVGIVGGTVQANPAVGINLRMLGVTSSGELGAVMGAVGLAQNFAALRALVTSGIQRGHMALHARTLVAATGATGATFETAVLQLVSSGDIKAWRAQEIVSRLNHEALNATAVVSAKDPWDTDPHVGVGHGKVILIGEHAAVFGSHAVAVPIRMAVRARATDASSPGIHLVCPQWDINDTWAPDAPPPSKPAELVRLILQRLALTPTALHLEIRSTLPRGMGLGGSAALAVACIRALALHFSLELDNETVNEHAFACERLAHQTPSGVDNTVATWGRTILFRRGSPNLIKEIHPATPMTLVIGKTGIASSTAQMVEQVRLAHERNRTTYDGVFSQIDRLALLAAEAIETGRYGELGVHMNVCHGLLGALQVSHIALEELVHLARRHGALGAKLTGSGGGGSIVALCHSDATAIADAFKKAGYEATLTTLGPTTPG